jgi:hypothetical protein
LGFRAAGFFFGVSVFVAMVFFGEGRQGRYRIGESAPAPVKNFLQYHIWVGNPVISAS